MNKFPRLISKNIGHLFHPRLLFNSKTPVFLPFYHVVSNIKLPYILNYNYRDIKQFETELDFYLRYFKPVSLAYLLEKKPINEKVFHLSFDDGLKECAEIIAPILLKKGIPATFFINSGFVDNKELFHRYKASLILSKLEEQPNSKAKTLLKENNIEGDKILKTAVVQKSVLDKTAEILEIDFKSFLEINQPYLTTNQILNLKEQGFSIGAHGENHSEFWKITEDEQFNEIKASMDWLAEIVNPAIKAFSFPFTDDGASKSVLKRIHRENICHLTFGTAGLKNDEQKNHLQRFPVEQNGNFIHNIKAEFVYFALRKCVGKSTVKH